jgi:hypothetical protein
MEADAGHRCRHRVAIRDHWDVVVARDWPKRGILVSRLGITPRKRRQEDDTGPKVLRTNCKYSTHQQLDDRPQPPERLSPILLELHHVVYRLIDHYQICVSELGLAEPGELIKRRPAATAQVTCFNATQRVFGGEPIDETLEECATRLTTVNRCPVVTLGARGHRTAHGHDDKWGRRWPARRHATQDGPEGAEDSRLRGI